VATHIVVSPIRENGLGSVGGAQCRGNANGRPDHLADLSLSLSPPGCKSCVSKSKAQDNTKQAIVLEYTADECGRTHVSNDTQQLCATGGGLPNSLLRVG
jgi:hypothetical protein